MILHSADILVICDGMADAPGPPGFLPHALRRLARMGHTALVDNVPSALDVTSENAIPTILGGDPSLLPGRGALEALGLGVGPAPGLMAARLDFPDRNMTPARGHIALDALRRELPDYVRLIEGRGFRHLLLRPVSCPLPTLAGVRIWGESLLPEKIPAAGTDTLIAAAPIVRGIARILGFRPLTPPGATGDVDTSLPAKTEAAIRLLTRGNRVCVHIEAPDEAAHRRDPALKRSVISAIDRLVISPLLDFALSAGRSLTVLSDHATDPITGLHVRGPVPAFTLSAPGGR